VIFVWRDLGVNIARFNASSSSMIMKLLWLGISVIWLGAGLGLFLSFAPAFAQEYQPPSDRGRQQQADAQGSRGDCNNQVLHLLIPEDHTPNTIAAHPSFFFYSEFKRVNFVLSAPGRSEPLYEREMMINTPRVVRVEIPETAPHWKLVKNMCGRWLLGVPQLERFTLVLRSDGWNSRQN
jgi:hypothetical protein